MGAKAIDIDIGNPRLIDFCQGVKRIYLLASKSDKFCLENPAEAADVMLTGMVNVLETAKKLGASVVFASSASAENPTEPYGLFKKLGEEMCAWYHEQGVPTVSLRFANVYGGKDDYVVSRFIEAQKNGEPLTIYGNGNDVRDFIHVDDVARACLVAPTNGDVIEIGTGVGTTINQLAELVGGEVVYVKGGFTKTRITDPTKALEMGWRPHISLQEGINLMR
jgi:UDP-glucose 4-epimerase